MNPRFVTRRNIFFPSLLCWSMVAVFIEGSLRRIRADFGGVFRLKFAIYFFEISEVILQEINFLIEAIEEQ